MNRVREALQYIWEAVQLIPAAILVGIAGGGMGVLFQFSLNHGNEFFLAHPWLLFLLPVGGVLSVLIYRGLRVPESMGMGYIFDMLTSDDKELTWRTAPAIFLTSTVTHLLGGSAGRTGGTLEAGASLSYFIGGLLHLSRKNRKQLTLCGMAAVWAGLFGTPVAGVLFAMEALSVGSMYAVGLIPGITAAVSGHLFAQFCGASTMRFTLNELSTSSAAAMGQAAVLGVAVAVLTLLYCGAVNGGERFAKKHIKNSFVRVIIGGCAVIVLTLLVGSYKYNGLGAALIGQSVGGGEGILWYDFLLKLLFTAVTMGMGFRGGKIMPALVIGATFGAVLGPLIGMDTGVAAALCMVGALCGIMNCPITCIFWSVEVFGGTHLLLFVITSAICYVFSGYCGIYPNQNIIFSKLGKKQVFDRKVQ